MSIAVAEGQPPAEPALAQPQEARAGQGQGLRGGRAVRPLSIAGRPAVAVAAAAEPMLAGRQLDCPGPVFGDAGGGLCVRRPVSAHGAWSIRACRCSWSRYCVSLGPAARRGSWGPPVIAVRERSATWRRRRQGLRRDLCKLAFLHGMARVTSCSDGPDTSSVSAQVWRSPVYGSSMTSRSAWAEKALGATKFLSSGSGGLSMSERSACTATPASAKPSRPWIEISTAPTIADRMMRF